MKGIISLLILYCLCVAINFNNASAEEIKYDHKTEFRVTEQIGSFSCSYGKDWATAVIKIADAREYSYFQPSRAFLKDKKTPVDPKLVKCQWTPMGDEYYPYSYTSGSKEEAKYNQKCYKIYSNVYMLSTASASNSFEFLYKDLKNDIPRCGIELQRYFTHIFLKMLNMNTDEIPSLVKIFSKDKKFKKYFIEVLDQYSPRNENITKVDTAKILKFHCNQKCPKVSKKYFELLDRKPLFPNERKTRRWTNPNIKPPQYLKKR